MSLWTSGASLRSVALTPETIPRFHIPSPARCSPLRLLSAPPCASPPGRSRLLSGDSAGGPSDDGPDRRLRTPSRCGFLRMPTPGRGVRVGRAGGGDADTDASTRGAMSLAHVQKVTTPYGFRAVLKASPCCRRRESLFHRKRETPAMVVTDSAYAELLSEAPEREPSPAGFLANAKARSLNVLKALTPR